MRERNSEAGASNAFVADWGPAASWSPWVPVNVCDELEKKTLDISQDLFKLMLRFWSNRVTQVTPQRTV